MLETVWFLLWGILWAAYFILDGFDLGAGTLMPFIAKSEMDKRYILNAGGPFWDGNEVWLITAGGVTFAAFPPVYAAMFSGLYTALMLLLFALIVRGVAFEYRHQLESGAWKKLMDAFHVVGSFVPALLLGVAFANIFQGLPLDENGYFVGGILDLLNPYGLAGGVLFVLLFTVHGGIWLALRTPGELSQRAANAAIVLWPILLVVAVGFLIFTGVATDLYANYLASPLLLVILLAPAVGLVGMRWYMGMRQWFKAWVLSALTIFGVAMFGVVGIFPALLPSTIDPAYSLTIHNSTSSTLTLKIMLGVALTFVPIVIIYQALVYKKFAKRLAEDDLLY
jgi:cytochrome d ubiquinol oxidase subunit II